MKNEDLEKKESFSSAKFADVLHQLLQLQTKLRYDHISSDSARVRDEETSGIVPGSPYTIAYHFLHFNILTFTNFLNERMLMLLFQHW